MNWRKAWWNPDIHKRANLHKLSEEMRLANDPWFVLKRENVSHCFEFVKSQPNIVQIVNSGGLANESLFAIILYCVKEINNVIASATHMTDWSRRSSSTSPHVFTEANNADIAFIEQNLEENDKVMFIRKIHPNFPEQTLLKYIYDYQFKKDAELKWNEPLTKKTVVFLNCVYFLSIIVIAWFFITPLEIFYKQI